MKKTLFFVLSLAMAGCSSPNTLKTHSAASKPLFDVPALASKNIDQIKVALGKQSTSDTEPSRLQLKKGITEWEKEWTRDSVTLLVTYNAKTRQVIDFFASNKRGNVAGVTPLFTATKLQEKNLGLRVVRVPALVNNDLSTGIKITVESSQKSGADF